MERYRPSLQIAAILLAMLAGFVDAMAFVGLGGFFASFMSGNTTRMGVALAMQDRGAAMMAGALILSFLSGVMFASILSARLDRWHQPAVMALVTLILAAAALVAPWSAGPGGLILLAMAMGAENGTFAREGEVSIGLTYMTGTLVRVGQRLTAALMGTGPRFGWLPYLLLWLGFAAGVVSGARSFAAMGAAALWLAVAASAALMLLTARLATR